MTARLQQQQHTFSGPVFLPNIRSQIIATMPGTAEKHKKREAYRSSLRADKASTALPRKKFYRQRAHANPFSDHNLM